MRLYLLIQPQVVDLHIVLGLFSIFAIPVIPSPILVDKVNDLVI